MKLLALLTFIFSMTVGAQTIELKIPTDIYHNNEELFLTHEGPGAFDSTLAMNVLYAPVKSLHSQLEASLGKKLDYFKLWNPEGEAHITVVTPVEFFNVLKAKLSMKEINAIAERYDIQEARMSILGLGSGKAWIEGKEEETYFLIVDSAGLRNIRQQIWYEFTRRGGDAGAFDPTWFFPHITIGYTKRDLHEADGILKNLKNSLDSRFKLTIR
jgi:2'-5' RNA ligase